MGTAEAAVHRISWGLDNNQAHTFTVAPGDTVVWTWDQSGYHNLVGVEGADGAEWGVQDTFEDYEFSRVFDAPGDYFYYCAPHHW